MNIIDFINKNSSIILYYNNENQLYFSFKKDTGYVEHPRKNMGYESTFITFERDFYSPDENPFEEWDDMLKSFGVKFDEYGKRDMYSDLEQLQENALKKGYIAMPVWKYEHSGLAYRAADRCPFPDFGYDSNICGVIYEKRNRRNIEEVRNELKAQVDEYSQYANGDIYRLDAYDKNGVYIDGCGGFYADYINETLVSEFAIDFLDIEIHKSDLEKIL